MSNAPELDEVIAGLNIDWSTPPTGELSDEQRRALENISRILMNGGVAKCLAVLEINQISAAAITQFWSHIQTARERIEALAKGDPDGMFDKTNLPLITTQARDALKNAGGIVSRETAVSLLERQSLDYASGIVRKLRTALKPNPSHELQSKISRASLMKNEQELMNLFSECEELQQRSKIRNSSLEELAELVRQSTGDDKIAALQAFIEEFDKFARSTI